MAAVKGPKNRRSSAAEQRRSSEERRNYINYNTTPDSRRHGQDNSAVLALAWATLRSTCGGCIFVRGMSLQRLQLRRRQRRRLLLTSHLGPSRTVAVHPLVRARTARTARRRRTTQSHATDKRAARRPGRSHRLTNSPLLSTVAVRCFRPVAARNRPSAAPRLLACDTPYCIARPTRYMDHSMQLSIFPEATRTCTRRYCVICLRALARAAGSTRRPSSWSTVIMVDVSLSSIITTLHLHHRHFMATTPWYHVASCELQAASCKL